MIKTLPKLFSVLEILDTIRWTPLRRLSTLSDIPKPSLCHLLSTMQDLGYVENNGKGAYRLSEKFCNITQKPFPSDLPQKKHFQNDCNREKAFPEQLSMRICVDLAEKTRESAVIGVLTGTKISIVAQARYNQTFMIDLSIYRDLSIYHSTTGRLILAYLSSRELSNILSFYGMPGKQWEDLHTKKALKDVLAKIRKNGYVFMENTKEAFRAISFPFFDKDHIFCGAVGMTVPHARLKGYESFIEKELRSSAEKLTEENIKHNISFTLWRTL
ncbi:MAG: helix-turn-helix domain-containing protein [Lentisphaeria bacterium]|nr:helix-turn-helix domain-containing protein [Lentisphaeria bacterium]